MESLEICCPSYSEVTLKSVGGPDGGVGVGVAVGVGVGVAVGVGVDVTVGVRVDVTVGVGVGGGDAETVIIELIRIAAAPMIAAITPKIPTIKCPFRVTGIFERAIVRSPLFFRTLFCVDTLEVDGLSVRIERLIYKQNLRVQLYIILRRTGTKVRSLYNS